MPVHSSPMLSGTRVSRQWVRTVRLTGVVTTLSRVRLGTISLDADHAGGLDQALRAVNEAPFESVP